MGSPSALLGLAAVCLLVPLSVGCQVGCQEQAIVHHPAYEQLEQGCFGYEPTVWRTMGGDCQQTLRMIPNEVVHVPSAAPSVVAPAEPAAPPIDEAATAPEQPTLESVPDPNPLNDIPRIVQPDALPDTPATPETEETPESDQPLETPAEPAAKQPAAVPGVVVPNPASVPAAEPELPKSPPSADPPMSRAQSISRPVIMGPAIEPASAAANELFRTVSEALDETSPSTRMAAQRSRKPAAAGLSRFISY